jgi:4-hydroxybenzoate polyprenyltransferase
MLDWLHLSGAYLPSEFPLRRGLSDALTAYVRLARPFTLLAPSLGMVSGGIVAWFAVPHERLVDAQGLVANLILGAVAAALLNAASNAINQVFDLDIDRVNKPDRPLTSGAISTRGALVFSAVTTGLALLLAALCSSFTGRPDVLLLFIAAAVFSVLYSAPPVRMKLRGWLANGTVAIPRGVLLKVAGWSLCASMVSLEAWFIGLIMGLFLFGATTTKDFSDITGDAAYGVRTLPVVYGPDRASRLIAPFLFLPFLLIGAGALTNVLHGNMVDLFFLCGIATCWGGYVAVLVLRDPDSLTRTENHPAWRHMYYLMVFLQVGFMLAYLPHNIAAAASGR